jgi:hypothetical protein
MLEYVIATGLILGAATVIYLRSSRVALYRDLGQRQTGLRTVAATLLPPLARQDVPAFDDRLVTVSNVLPEAVFSCIRDDIEAMSDSERSYLPTHKKGGTIAYETLVSGAPSVVALYLSPELGAFVSRIVGIRVEPTPLHDQSSCSVLRYERPGDHIGWHYDHNFYKGRHFTALIPIVNRGLSASGLSDARLMAKVAAGERTIETPPNTMVLFEGAKVLHKVTPILDGERRVVLSMTFCADPSSSRLQGLVRRVKDTAFFGVRALWT